LDPRHRPALRSIPHRLGAQDLVVGEADRAVVVYVELDAVEPVGRLDPHHLAGADERLTDQRIVGKDDRAIGVQPPLAVLPSMPHSLISDQFRPSLVLFRLIRD
jgi:hypothetical protein